MKEKFHEHDYVRLKDYHRGKHLLEAGTTGTIVHLYSDDVAEVEVSVPVRHVATISTWILEHI